MSSNDEGLDKSALLLMALGADEAAEVLKQLGPKEVQKLGAAMAAMPAQSREKLEEILDEVLLFAEKGTPIEADHDHIKAMLTKFQTWGRVNHIWVVIVAHPRGLKTVNGRNELEAINMYTISGSANWANLADFILTVSRISEPDRAFTRIDMLKVRDQELCRTGTVYYTRRPCGRYEEHESEEECRAE